MHPPKAYFYAKPNGLEVSFYNRTVPGGTGPSYVWDFGDGNSSTQENPTHTYSESGYYRVKFSCTDSEGTSSVALIVYFSASGITGTEPIMYMVKARIPQDVSVTDQDIYSETLKWQEVFYDSFPSVISYENRHDETLYSALENSVIAKLVVRDLIAAGANSYLLTLGGGSSSGGSGDIKKITTGPADAEWFSASSSWYGIMRPGSLWDQLNKEICTLGSVLQVKMPGCEGNSVIMAPQIKSITRDPISPDNQFTYHLDLAIGTDTPPSVG